MSKKKNKQQMYIFVDKRYTLEEVFLELNFEGDDKNRRVFDGNSVKLNSLRLHTFNQKGCTCVSCGREGTHFKLQKNVNDESYHLGLWSEDGEQLSKDHIIPKSRGGLDTLGNMQTMCIKCNTNKSNAYSKSDYEKGEAIDKLALNPNGDVKRQNTNMIINAVEKKELEKKEAEYKENVSILRKKYSHLHESKKLIQNFNTINKINTFIEKDNLDKEENKEIIEAVEYVISYYVEIIELHKGVISLNNKILIGLPTKVRKHYIELVKEKYNSLIQ